MSSLKTLKSVKERRQYIEKETGVTLKHVGSFTLNEQLVSRRNCENMIGAVQVPLGVAGPLTITRTNIQQQTKYFIPLATTEGALVASVNRGCKAIRESGSAKTRSLFTGVTRGPVFETRSLTKSEEFCRWLGSNRAALEQISQSTSSHLRYLDHLTKTTGNYTYVRFCFDTQDAMGMNMVTIATQALVEHIHKETGVKCVSLAGNFDIDKKPAWLNIVSGRGREVWAEVIVPEKVARDVLKTTVKKMHKVWESKCLIGSAMSGSLGFNAHFANVIAAMFIATGQDPAHVTEGSQGITTTEVVSNHGLESLYVSVYMPNLMVGTVGGGTNLETQNEALQILGVAGGNEGKNADEFAQIVGAAVLAGEISLLASLSEHTLSASHQRLARP